MGHIMMDNGQNQFYFAHISLSKCINEAERFFPTFICHIQKFIAKIIIGLCHFPHLLTGELGKRYLKFQFTV